MADNYFIEDCEKLEALEKRLAEFEARFPAPAAEQPPAAKAQK